MVALHLGPGLALLSVFVLAAPVLAANGLPPLWALLGGVLTVLVPIEVGLLVVLRRRERSAGRPVGPLFTLGRLRPRQALLTTLVVLVASLVLPGLMLPIEAVLRDLLAGVLPGLVPRWPRRPTAQQPAVVAITLTLWLLSAVLVGPLVEEAWFRAHLQPRIPLLPVPAALVGSVLFAAYHFWQPHAVLTVLAFTVPIAVLVARTGATAIGAIVHITVNLATFAGLLTDVLVR